MKMKRVLSGTLAAALVLGTLSEIKPAAYAAAEEDYILNDTFDKSPSGSFDSCGWTVGASEEGLEAVFPTSHWAMADMALVSIPKGGSGTPGKTAVVRKELENPIDLTKQRVVVETVLSADTTYGINVDFGYNRPADYTEMSSDVYTNRTNTLFRVVGEGGVTSAGKGYTAVNMLNPSHGLTKATNFGAAAGTPEATDGVPKLIFQDSVKVKMILDYQNDLISYYITAPDGGTYTRDGWGDNGNMKVNGASPTTLESIDFSAWCQNGSKYWIDYVKVYTLDPMINSAEISGNGAEFSDGYGVKNGADCVIEAKFVPSVEDETVTLTYHGAGATERKTASVTLRDLEAGGEYSVRLTLDKDGKTAAYELYRDGEKLTFAPATVSGIDFSAFGIIDGVKLSDGKLSAVSAYNKKAVVGAKLEKKDGAHKFYLGDKMTLSFDSPIDGEKIESGIEFYLGEAKNIVSGTYNEKTGQYTFSLDGKKSGDWEIKLSDGLILGNDGDSRFETNTISFNYVGSTKPEIRNLKLNGRVTENSKITADYEYFQAENVAMGESIHEWYVSDSLDGTYVQLKGENEKELTISAELVGKYIKYAIIPVTEDGAIGDRTWSDNIIAPEVAPFATDVKIKGTAGVGATLYLEYTFNDANGDSEGLSEYFWYTADSDKSETAAYKEIAGENGRSLRVTQDMLGKYIAAAVRPVSITEPNDKKVYYSEPTSKVGDLKEMTNLVANADFEKGNTSGWTTFNFGSGDGVFVAKAEDGDPTIGNYSMLVKGKNSASHTYISPSFTLKGGKTYIAGGKVYPTDRTMSKIYAKTNTLSGVTLTRPYEEAEKTDAKEKRWTEVYSTWAVDGASCSDSRLSLQSDSYTENFYVDDVYVGELEMTGISAEFDKTELTVPQSGTETVTVSAVAAINQLGTTHGLTEETVTWKTAESYSGVKISDANDSENPDAAAYISVDSNAVAGVIELVAECRPQYAGHTAQSVETRFFITLLPHSDTAPKVRNVRITGATSEGSTLVGDYDYYQVNGYRDCSEYEWYVSDTADGEYRKIEGENGLSYTVSAENAGKFITLKVYPKSEQGLSGEKAEESNTACAPKPPVAKNVTVSGEHGVGAKLGGSYEFYDDNMDSEGATVFRWLRADGKDGAYTAIGGETGKEYVLTEADVNKYIKFEVTPVSEGDPATAVGKTYLSEAFAGPKTPEARNVKISVNGTMLTGSYEYYHEFGAAEGKSKYEWLSGTGVIAEGISMIADVEGEIIFRVTPISKDAPYSGTPQSASVVLSSGGGGGGSGGSGGGGRGGSSSIFAGGLPSTTVKPQETIDPGVMSDMENHWARSAAERLISKGIIKKDTDETFAPDRNVTRSEVIEAFAKAAKIEKADYAGEFEDVSSMDSYSGYLQAMVNEGIISHDRNFRPKADITRQEFAKIIYITLNNREKLVLEKEAEISDFADSDSIAPWAREYVGGVLKTGLMIGTSETTFSPTGKITKAQMAVVLSRMMDLLGE